MGDGNEGVYAILNAFVNLFGSAPEDESIPDGRASLTAVRKGSSEKAITSKNSIMAWFLC